MGRQRDDKEYYIREAKRHLECLERFSGMQPDYHLNEIAIRFWDDYWFGKNRTKGDTLPHHLSVLTARAYIAYSLLSGEKKWMDKAEECLRNCMCLIGDNVRIMQVFLKFNSVSMHISKEVGFVPLFIGNVH